MPETAESPSQYAPARVAATTQFLVLLQGADIQNATRHGDLPPRGVSDAGDRAGPRAECRFGYRARRQVDSPSIFDLGGDHLGELIFASANKVQHVLCIVR